MKKKKRPVDDRKCLHSTKEIKTIPVSMTWFYITLSRYFMELLYIVKGSVVKLNLPQVVRVIDTSHQAFLVEHPRLCWTFLKKKKRKKPNNKKNKQLWNGAIWNFPRFQSNN
jgi:hypothetical protein